MLYKFTAEDLTILCDLLCTRANKIISRPYRDEHYYVSGCQAFLYFVKRDRVKVERRLSLVLNNSISRNLSSCGDVSSINVPALVSYALLGNYSLDIKDIGVTKNKIVSFGNSVIMDCLTTRSIFFMGYGYNYQSNLRERISYIKSGLLSKAPVGYEELGISYKQYVLNRYLYNVNDLVSVLYSGKLSGHCLTSDIMLKLESSGVLFGSLKNGLCYKGVKASKSHLVLGGSNGLFSLPYPMNFVCDAFSISLSDYLEYSDEVAYFGDYILNNLGMILSGSSYRSYLRDYLFIIEKFYKDCVSFDELNKLCGYTVEYSVVERLRKFIKCLNGYYSLRCPVNLKPWDKTSANVLCSSSHSVKKPVSSTNSAVSKTRVKPVNSKISMLPEMSYVDKSAMEKVSEARKIQKERTDFYNSHRDYLHQMRVEEEKRTNFISDFVFRLRGVGDKNPCVDVDFVLNKFHNCYASLYEDFGSSGSASLQLGNSSLSYEDCVLLSPFLDCTEYNFMDLISNVKGCNPESDEGESAYFGFLSLLLRIGLVDICWLSVSSGHRWVFPKDSVLLSYPLANFVYCDYVGLCDYNNSVSYTGVMDKFSQSLNIVLQKRFGEIACGLRGSYSDSGVVSIKISGFYNWVFEICSYLISLGFRSANAVGFYLMCGMDGYFSKLSEFELEVLKETLKDLGMYSPKN